MNILIINLILHTAEKGVIPKHRSNADCMIYNMARGFVDLGHKVTLIASEEYRPSAGENNPFEVVYFPSVMPGLFRPDLLPYPKGFKRWLRHHRDQYDKVISSETFSFGTLAAAEECPEKLVIWQEMASLQRAFRKIPARIWYGIVAKIKMSGVRVIPRSERSRDFISRYMGNVSEVIVDHGVNGEIFHPSDTGKQRRLVVISQLIKRKRIDTIIKKFSDFIKLPGYGDFHLDIVGDGPERWNLENEVRKLGIESNVKFHGRLRHIEFAPISAGAMAFLVNTENDLNMVSIPEAITCGTPIVTNTVPTCTPFLIKEGLGIAKDNWDEEDLRYIVEHNKEFVENCLRVRPTLLNTGCAKALLEN